MSRHLMTLLVMLCVGFMSMPMSTEAGLFSKSTKYDVILENSEVVSLAENTGKVLETNGSDVRYLKFLFNDTPIGLYRKLASAENTDSDFLYFVKANKEFCFNLIERIPRSLLRG